MTTISKSQNGAYARRPRSESRDEVGGVEERCELGYVLEVASR